MSHPDEPSPGSSKARSPAPFLLKTYDLVNDPEARDIISWNHEGTGFVVWMPQEFSQSLLPKYFKHANFSSFIRQLNTYGFKKAASNRWEFKHEKFVKGGRHLLMEISRKKGVPSVFPAFLKACDNTRVLEQDLLEENKSLKIERASLQSEINYFKGLQRKLLCCISECVERGRLGELDFELIRNSFQQ
ncbi:hypothetical protein AMTRI_Chr07g31250 [Amborella trichopoda]|uniref:HSF-type DNA-binding domain-containing protein n=1 Tax=Amborella trichopoda TaxID=13333 RepID=W1NJ12_AMBTC|nr:heat stress transcription factor B-4d [Amborella trichopoda]ERM95189.1 hypothetical protein AMTR_s00009p00264800 [Amborella trichopoda]|eukprot:XP_006827773.1 heat stress transcription factor B-4d [Amborella trichopoda]